MNINDYIGKTASYTVYFTKGGLKKITGKITEIVKHGDAPWFVITYHTSDDKPCRIMVPVWYALEWIEDWTVK